MAKPFSSLPTNIQELFRAIGNTPDDEMLRRIVPDGIELEGGDLESLANVLRTNNRAALQMVLREYVPDKAECDDLLQSIDDGTVNTSQRISQMLWMPQRPPIPDLRTPEGLRAHYESQRILAASGGLPVEDCFGEVQQHLASPAVREELGKGPRLLLLVPRRPFAEYAALEGWLRDNTHLLKLDEGSSLAQEPVTTADRYKQGLEYHCPVVDENGQHTFVWKNEEEWLAEKQTDILVVDPSADLPASARSRSARQAWSHRKPGEVFLTPQAWTMFFRTLLERGELLDANTFSILAGARFAASANDSVSSSRRVPYALWNPGDRRVRFGWRDPDRADGCMGVRGSR